MMALEHWLWQLEGSLPAQAEAGPGGGGLDVTGVDLELPVEAGRHGKAGLAVSLPRGRLATGFDRPRGRIRVRFERGDL